MTTNVSQVGGQRKPLHTAGGNINLGGHCENRCGNLKETENKTSIGPSYSLWGHIPKRLLVNLAQRQLHIYACYYIVTQSRKQNQPRWPSTDKWIKKTCYVHTREVYAAGKENETVAFVGNWIKLEIKILSKIRQTPKDKYHIYANLSFKLYICSY